MRIPTTAIALAAAFLQPVAQANDGETAPLPRLVWAGEDVSSLGAPTRDGRMLTIVDKRSGDLAFRSLLDGATKRITHSASSGEFSYFSVPSRDGNRLAYAWFNDEGFYELRVTDADSPGTARTVYKNPEAGFVQPCAFSPDGEQILTLLFRRDNVSQIVLISASDGAARVLKSLQWIYPKRMDLSPDGKYVVYDNLSERDADERDVFVLAVDGSRESRLVAGAANDLFPLWAPSGKMVLYSSDASGESALWSVPVADGQAAGEARLVRAGMGRFLPLGVTDQGALVYAQRRGGPRLEQMGLDGAGRRPLFEDTALTDRFSPSYSPDGSALAYLTRVSSENYGQEHRAVAVRSLADGIEREAPDRMAHVERVAWSPEARGLVLQGSDRRGRAGLFFFNLQSGRTEPLFIDQAADFRGTPGVLLADGQVLVARDRELIRIASDRRTEETATTLEAGLDMLALAPDGARIAFAQLGAAHSVWVASAAGAEPTRILELPSGKVTDVVWTGADELLVGTSGSGGARMFLVSAAGDRMRPVPSPKDRLPGVSVRDGRVAFARGGEQEAIWVLDDVAAAH